MSANLTPELQALNRLNANLEALIQALTAKPALPGEPRVETSLSVSFQLNPAQLNEILIGTPAVRGYISGNAQQFEAVVPAGGSHTVVVPVLDGYVTTLVGDLSINTTNVGAGVTAAVTLDGHSIIGPLGYVIGPGGAVGTAQYNYAETSGVEVVLTNPSTETVTIYFGATAMNIARAFYDDWIVPLENAAYQQISRAFGLTIRG